MQGEEDDKALKARLDRLKGEIGAAKTEPPRFEPPFKPLSRSDRAAVTLAVRASSEIVAGVAVGAVIGWGLDKLTGLKPAFLILFMLLGLAAGVGNVVRATMPKGGA